VKRISIVVGVIALLILGDGVYQSFNHYHPQDQNQVWNSSVIISDGTTMIISGLLLLVIAGAMWWWARREQHRRDGPRTQAARVRR
jgi:hypothetical protein